MPKILIFDAEHMLGGMYLTKFNMNGFEAKYYDHVPRNVVEVVANEKPDIISMDIVMREMDGLQATALLQTDPRTKDIPLYFLSNLGQPDDINRGMAFGAVDYLVKAQNTPSDVVERARKILGLPHASLEPTPPPSKAEDGASVQPQFERSPVQTRGIRRPRSADVPEADPQFQALHESGRQQQENDAAERRATIRAWFVLGAVIVAIIGGFMLHWLLGVLALLVGAAVVLKDPGRPL